MFKPAFDIVVNRINPLKSQLNAQSERHQIHTPKATSLSIKCTFQVEKIEQKNKKGKFAKLGHVCEKCKPGVFFVAAIYINASDVGSHKALVFQQSDAIIKIHSARVCDCSSSNLAVQNGQNGLLQHIQICHRKPKTRKLQ